MSDDKREKAKVLLADRLRTLQAADFLSFEDVVRHLQRGKSLASCIVKLANLISSDGFDKIYGDLFDRLEDKGKKKLTVATWKKALIGEIALVEQLLENIREDELPPLFKFWLTGTEERVTWEQLVNASPYAVLRACAAEGDQRADEAAADAEVVDETVDVEPTNDDEPSGKPSE